MLAVCSINHRKLNSSEFSVDFLHSDFDEFHLFFFFESALEEDDLVFFGKVEKFSDSAYAREFRDFRVGNDLECYHGYRPQSWKSCS